MNLRINLGVLAFLGACTMSSCTMAPAVAMTAQERGEIRAQIKAMREEVRAEKDAVRDVKLLQQLEKAKADLAKVKK
jgi:uncharacterized protein YycO